MSHRVSGGSIYFTELIRDVQATPEKEIQSLLRTLDAHKGEWARLDIGERLLLLDQVRVDMWALRDRWIEAEREAKGIPPQSLGVAEEWVMLAQVFRAIAKIERSLRDIQRQGRPAIPGPVASGPNGRVAARVFPQTIWDRLIFAGVTADVWMEPGLTPQDVAAGQAARYRDRDYPGKVALVLGAGNASMLPVCDAFHKLFVDLQVVALKMNPVNAHLGALIGEGLRALIGRGFLGIVYGAAEVGSYLSSHPIVQELHMTGSDKTYEAVVFGDGAGGRQRKAEKRPLNTKPFTGELSNVSPVIVVPGPWTQRDIDEYAKHIATWLVVNAGFACLTPRVILQHRSWPQRTRLTEAIRRELARCPTRKAFYPGASEIHRDFTAAHPEALLIGASSGDRLPWTIVPDLEAETPDEICFAREAFCGLSAEASLAAATVEAYLDRAVDFVNHRLWGTLCATLIVHPKSLQQRAVREAVDRAIARLQYGTVSVNMLAFYSTYFGVTPWGAMPGHSIYDIQSGRGKNFNYLMFERPEKVVIRAPFWRFDPLTVRSKRAYVFAEKLAGFEASPTWPRLAGLMWAALRC